MAINSFSCSTEFGKKELYIQTIIIYKSRLHPHTPMEGNDSDVKRGQNLEDEAEAEARATMPRPISGGRGQGRGQK